MAIRTILINSSISSLIDGDHSAVNLATILAGSVLLAKALKAFASVKRDDDKALLSSPWSAIAKTAKVSEYDAAAMVTHCAKDSSLRTVLRNMRMTLVAIGRNGQILHDATIHSIDIVVIDKIVSALAIINEHKTLLIRPV